MSLDSGALLNAILDLLNPQVLKPACLSSKAGNLVEVSEMLPFSGVRVGAA